MHEQTGVRRYANNVKIHSAPIVKLAVRDGVILTSSNDTYLKYFKLVDIEGVKVWDKFGFNEENLSEEQDSLDEIYGTQQLFKEDNFGARNQKQALYDIQETLDEDHEQSTFADSQLLQSESLIPADALIYGSMIQEDQGETDKFDRQEMPQSESCDTEPERQNFAEVEEPSLTQTGGPGLDINSDLLSYIQSHTMSELLQEIKNDNSNKEGQEISAHNTQEHPEIPQIIEQAVNINQTQDVEALDEDDFFD